MHILYKLEYVLAVNMRMCVMKEDMSILMQREKM